MKRILSLILTFLLAASLLCGCSSEPAPTTEGAATTAPETTAETVPETAAPTQSPEEAEVLKIIVIGNSHSNDAFWLLQYAFQDQMPDQELILGAIYYSGCSIDQHIQFTTERQNVYAYHKNENGKWKTQEDVPIETGLCDEAWDVIIFQAGSSDTADKTLNKDGRDTLAQIVRERISQPYTMVWHSSWPSPNDPTFFSPTYEVQPPSGTQQRLQERYGHDPFVQFEHMVTVVKDNILDDDTYELAICTGAGVMYAHATLGVPQLDLWRDYTHLSDYGRLIAAYCLYAQFTGNTVETINLDLIPAGDRVRRARSKGDLIVTEEMKQVIIASANHSLEDPWTVPAKPAN